MISLIFCLWFNGMSPSHALINWYYFCASSLMFWWTLWGMWTRMPSLSSALDFFRSALLPNVENWASGHGVCFFCWSSKGIFLSTLPVVAVLGSLSTVNSGSIYQERSLKTFLLLPHLHVLTWEASTPVLPFLPLWPLVWALFRRSFLCPWPVCVVCPLPPHWQTRGLSLLPRLKLLRRVDAFFWVLTTQGSWKWIFHIVCFLSQTKYNPEVC